MMKIYDKLLHNKYTINQKDIISKKVTSTKGI